MIQVGSPKYKYVFSYLACSQILLLMIATMSTSQKNCSSAQKKDVLNSKYAPITI
jgi:hypothetical protein